MPNTFLENKRFLVPNHVLKNIPNSRVKQGLLNQNNSQGGITEDYMEKIRKRMIDNPQKYGGTAMKKWIEQTLKSNRSIYKNKKKIMNDMPTIVAAHKFRDNNIYNMKNGERSYVTRNLYENSENDKSLREHNQFVVGCILDTSGKILVLQRSEKAKWHHLKWGFLGGYLEDNLSPKENMIKECKEEIGVTPIYCKLCFILKDNNMTKYMFVCVIKENNLTLNYENKDYKWLSQKEFFQLNEKEMIPYQKAYLKKIKQIYQKAAK